MQPESLHPDESPEELWSFFWRCLMSLLSFILLLVFLTLMFLSRSLTPHTAGRQQLSAFFPSPNENH